MLLHGVAQIPFFRVTYIYKPLSQSFVKVNFIKYMLFFIDQWKCFLVCIRFKMLVEIESYFFLAFDGKFLIACSLLSAVFPSLLLHQILMQGNLSLLQ